MAEHKIVRYCLQSRASQLKAEKKSYRDIAKILSRESGHSVSNTSVQRYFEAMDQAKVEVVERSDRLKAKLVEAEFNTVAGCVTCIEDLQEICAAAKEAGDLKTAVLAIDSIYKGLDMLNKILGKYQTGPQNQFNFMEVNIDGARDRIISRITSLASRARDIRDAEFDEP